MTPLKFDDAYNTNCTLELATGRKIVLDSLHQSRTYAGLLEGTPNKKSNDMGIKWALDRARKISSFDSDPCLIEPERRDYFREPGDMDNLLEQQADRPHGFKRIPEWLPQVECIGIFSSSSPAREQSKNASSLIIVWYQNLFGIDDDAMESIRQIPWDEHAIDWEY